MFRKFDNNKVIRYNIHVLTDKHTEIKFKTEICNIRETGEIDLSTDHWKLIKYKINATYRNVLEYKKRRQEDLLVNTPGEIITVVFKHEGIII